MRRLVWASAVVVAAGLAAWLLLRRPAPPPAPPGPPEGEVWFEDVAAKAGLGFRHFDPATPLPNVL